MIREQCANCRFSGYYTQPDPLPVPVERSILWGLIKWTDGPDEIEECVYEYQKDLADNTVPCFRQPKPIEKPKTAWCGEYKLKEK
jgi:hypothetical protein